jgi:hypothetical protein
MSLKHDMSIDEYYSAFDRLMGSLTSMVPECSAVTCPAHKFIEKFFPDRFVMGVRAEYDSIRTRLLYSSSDLTMANALSDLLAEETRLKSLSSAVSHGVLAASQRTSAPNSTSAEPCRHCGRTGHLSDNCFSHHLEKLAEYRARRAAHGGRGRGTGSTSRGSVSVVASSTISAPSTWVLDSGASFHVTSDESQLVACKPVPDGASIQTADDTSCYITHQDSLCNNHFSVPNVSFVPQLSMNFLSVGQVTDQNCFVGFDVTQGGIEFGTTIFGIGLGWHQLRRN